MDIDQLQSVRDRERDREGLQELREDFYVEAAAFVRELRAEREEAASEADDLFDDPRVSRLTDRIRTAENTLEAIYEKRIGKLLTAATLAAADFPTEAEGMTREEAELFETLVAEIEAHREEVLGRLSGEAGAADAVLDADAAGEIQAEAAGDSRSTPNDGESDDASGVETEPPTESADGPGAETADGPEVESADGPEAGESVPPTDQDPDPADDEGSDGTSGDETDVDRTLVRITADVGSILGVDDTEYDLAEDDVVTLPTANAEPLVERGAAERLE